MSGHPTFNMLSMMKSIREQVIVLMPCKMCGHLNKVHKKMTSTIYFCEDCKSVESYASFGPDAGDQKDNDAPSLQSTSTQDLLSEAYKTQRLKETQ